MIRKISAFAIFILLSSHTHAQVFINEIMSNNQQFIADADRDYPDWIELYNAGADTADITSYSLSDNSDSLQKWIFPSTKIPPQGFLFVWCSGKNRRTGVYHTNFSIESQGETIFLSDSLFNVVDNISAVTIPADKTYGRYGDGGSSLFFLSSASPGTSNNASIPYFGIEEGATIFNIQGGFFTSPQSITIAHPDPSAVIHYTTDGSEPTESSPVYNGPITVQSRAGDANYYSLIRTCYNRYAWLPDWFPPLNEVFKATVIRAAAFRPNYIHSEIKTNSYFVDANMFTRYGNLPVVSIVSDPKNLFSDSTGLYVPGINYQPGTYHANYYLPWNRPANIEYILPDGTEGFAGNYKINVNGQSSPSSPQKGLNVNASSDYGDTKINYPLFQDTPGKARFIQKFDKIKFRAWGSDRSRGLFRDAYCHSFFTKSDLDIEAYQPVVVFIDGEYWGLQEMRERNREGSYYQAHYLLDAKNPGFDILDGAGNNVLEGDATHWNNMFAFINANDLSIQANYDYVKTQMDVHSFILCYMASIYFSRGDWPDQNEAKWRPHTADGRWKWMLWDMDNTTAYYLNPWYNMFTQAITGNRGYGPSAILDELLESPEFKNDFINIFADYMNTEFIPQLAMNRVDSMAGQLSPFMSEYQSRWQANYNWQAQTDSMKWWVNLRPVYCKQQILTQFATPGTVNISLDVNDIVEGKIKINTLTLDENTVRVNANTFPWNGDYFSGVPVPVTAIARPGYHFVKWLPSNDTNAAIVLNLTNDTIMTALFDIDPSYISEIPPVINEVMSSNIAAVADNFGEYDDWVEIYNPGNDTLDLAGYYLTDNLVLTTQFRFAEGSDSAKIAPHGHLLVWVDDDSEQGALHTNFKFDANGDFIALIKPDGTTIVDSLRFGFIATDQSYGRRSDGALRWITFSASTPDSANWYNAGKIFINEVQTYNVTTIADGNGDYDQWVELYNPNIDTVDIASWKIINGAGLQSVIPPGSDLTLIPPSGFTLLWADNQSAQGWNHLAFTLSSSPGCITLSKPDDSIDDSVCYTFMGVDSSYGRVADGDPSWQLFEIPTPDSNNVDITLAVNPVSSKGGLSVYPNPVHGRKIYLSRNTSFILYDALGHAIAEMKNANEMDVSQLEKGFYFIRSDKGESVKFVIE